MPRRVLFGTSSWGLGHATRDLVLIKALLGAGCEVTVVATGPALAVLRRELRDKVTYLDWPDMPSTIATSTARFLIKTTASVPRILNVWREEKKRTSRLLADQSFDLVISDHRYGMVTDTVDCYFISHSPRYIAPWRSWFMETVMEWFVATWLKPAKKLLIPDDQSPGLAGEMDHDLRFLTPERYAYLGILASLGKRNVEQDIDVFISISGPEPQRTRLQKIVMPQLQALQGRIVVALGLPDGEAPPSPAGVEVHPYLNRQQQAKMMNRAGLVVCRSGYTTLMELAEIGKTALLVPTPGQTEQLYLADTLAKQGLYYSVRQGELDLSRDVARARGFPGYQPEHLTSASAERFVALVLDEATEDS